MSGPELDLDTVRTELERYTGAPGWLSLWSLPDKTSHCYPTTPDGIAEAVRDVGKLAVDQHSIYHRGTTLRAPVGRGERGGNADSAAWLAYRFDVDHGKDGYAPDLETAMRTVVSADLPEPSDWKDSGHGVHPVWELDPPVPHSPDAEALAEDIAAELHRAFTAAGYGLDTKLGEDPARVWRLAGTVNAKPDHPEPVGTSTLPGSGRAFRWGELRDAVPARPRRATRDAMGGRDRVFTRGEAEDYVERVAFSRLRTAPDGSINITLNDASLTLGHFVDEFIAADSPEEAEKTATRLLLDELAHTDYDAATWKAEPTIRSGLAAGRAEPYRRAPDPNAEPGTAEHEAALDADVRVELRRREVRRRADAEERPARRPLADMLVGAEDLERIEPPSFALRGLIRDRGIGFLGGMRGTHKTFLLTSWACHLALGRPWLDRDEFAVDRPRRVLYIAAEGGGDVRERVRAWEAEHDVTVSSDHLTVVDGPVRLNDPGDVAELTEIIRTGGWDLIIVDTFHRSTPGVNENDSAEVGAVFAALADWRDRMGVTVLLADHTGHRGDGLRGSSSKGDDADFVLLTQRRNNQVRLVVDKLKSVRDGQSYDLRLRPVPAVRNAKGDPSAVVEIGEQDPAAFTDAPWWERKLTDAADALITGRGRGVARDIVRFLLHHADNLDGFTEAAIRDALRKAPRYAATEDDRYRRMWWEGWTRARTTGAELAVRVDEARARFVIAEGVREASE